MITRVVFEFSVDGAARQALPWRITSDAPVPVRIIAVPSSRSVVAFERWIPCVPGGDPGRWEFVGTGDVPPVLLMRLAGHLAGAPPKGSGWTMETSVKTTGLVAGHPGEPEPKERHETLIIMLGTIDAAPFEAALPDALHAAGADADRIKQLEAWSSASTKDASRNAAILREIAERLQVTIPPSSAEDWSMNARGTILAALPPSVRVPEPGPCTEHAHNYLSGFATCQCGGATRTGDCRGWKVEGKSLRVRWLADELTAAKGQLDDIDALLPEVPARTRMGALRALLEDREVLKTTSESAHGAMAALRTISLRLTDVADAPALPATMVMTPDGIRSVLKYILAAFETLRRQQPSDLVRKRLAQIAGLPDTTSTDDAVTVIARAAQILRDENSGRKWPRSLTTLEALAQQQMQDIKILAETADRSELLLKEISAIVGLADVRRDELAAGIRALLHRYNRDADIVSAIDRLAQTQTEGTAFLKRLYGVSDPGATEPERNRDEGDPAFVAPFLLGTSEFRHHGRLVEIRKNGAVTAKLLIKSVPPSASDPLRVGPFMVRCTTCSAWRPTPVDSPTELIRYHLAENHNVGEEYEWAHRPAHAADWTVPLE